MNPTRLLLLLLILFLAQTVGAAAPPDAGAGPVSGVYAIDFNVNLASALPAGTLVVCKVKVVPGQSSSGGLSWAPAETATGVATVVGSTATCAVEIPMVWTVGVAQNGAALSYEIDVVEGAGAAAVVLRRSVQQEIGVEWAAAGGAANLKLGVTI